jgi:hypothetical protein
MTARWSVFAWQGWRMEVPGGWNPIMFVGDWRRGSAILADTGNARGEIHWVPWPGLTPPGLDKAIRKQAMHMERPKLRPADRWPLSEAFLGAQELVGQGANQDIRLVFNSPASCRVAVLRFTPTGLDDGPGIMRRVARSLADLSDQPLVPWSVYGLAFDVPQGFGLSATRFTADSAYLSFTGRRNELLRFARIAAAGRLNDQVGPVELMTQIEGQLRLRYAWQVEGQMQHFGHRVTVRRGTRTGWPLISRRGERCLDTAAWYCPTCDRIYELLHRARHSDVQRLRDLLRHVPCHG